MMQNRISGIGRTKVRSLKNILLICFVTVTSTAFPQVSLDSLLEYALQHSHEVKKAALQEREASFYRKEITGQGFPQVKSSAVYGKLSMNNINLLIPTEALSEEMAILFDQIEGMDKLYLAGGTIEVSQLIYSQSYWVGLKAAKKTQELYTILKRQTDEEVILNLSEGYFQVCALSLQQVTIDKMLKNLNEIFDVLKLNYQNELVKKTDVSRVNISVVNLETTRKTIDDGINIQVNYLKALAGIPKDSVLAVNVESFDDFPGSGLHEHPFVPENVPAYQVLLKQSELTHEQMRLAKAEYLPVLSAFGQFNKSAYNTKSKLDTWTGMNFIGLNLSFPVFTSGVTRAKVKQTEIKQFEINEDLSGAKDLLQVDYNNALSEYTSGLEFLNVHRQNRQLAIEVYNQSELQYKEGMISLTDLLAANNDFLQADNLYNQQLLKCRLALLKMLQTTGTLKTLINQE